LANVHFDSPLNFLDLFLPVNIASADRARAFLWLLYHYLEKQNTLNPFNDDYSRQHPGKVPWLRRLTEQEQQLENVDTNEEIEWGHKMSAQRNTFLQKLVSSIENEKKARNSNSLQAKGAFLNAFYTGHSPAVEPDLRRSRSYRRGHHMKDDEKFLHYIPDDNLPVAINTPMRGQSLESASGEVA
jgi:Ino eighty subunit 1